MIIRSATLRKLSIDDVEMVLASWSDWQEGNCDIIRRYWAGETMPVIGKSYRKSPIRVGQIIQKFLRICRHPSKWQRLSDEAKAAITSAMQS